MRDIIEELLCRVKGNFLQVSPTCLGAGSTSLVYQLGSCRSQHQHLLTDTLNEPLGCFQVQPDIGHGSPEADSDYVVQGIVGDCEPQLPAFHLIQGLLFNRSICRPRLSRFLPDLLG